MMEGIKEESVGSLFNLQVEVAENPIVEEAAEPAPLVLGQHAEPVQPATARQAGQVPGGRQSAGLAGPGGGRDGAGRGRDGAGGARDGAGARAGAGGGRTADRARTAGGGRSAGGGRAAGAGRGAAGTGSAGRHAASEPALPGGGAERAAGGAAPSVVAPGLSRPQRPSRLSYSAPTVDGGGQVEHRTEATGNGKYAKVGRNDLCPCGSGRKYKRCHGDPRNRGAV
jgi:hypothetical protein